MTDKWIIEDIERQIAQRNRIVILDPTGRCAFLLPTIEQNGYIILKTDPANIEHWQRVKEELLLRHEAESNHPNDKVVFYVTRPKNELSFLFDYCVTHGSIDLTNPAEWLKKKLFTHTGHQVALENPKLITAAKLGMGKDIDWWKKILQNLEELISVEDELLPFLSTPEGYLMASEPDIRRLFEEKLFELIGQPYRTMPATSLASEVVNHIFDSLLYNDITPELLAIYHKWLDSNTYSGLLTDYISTYKIDSQINVWNVHLDHCFTKIDELQLIQLTANFRDKSFVGDRIQRLLPRIRSRKAGSFIPSWWDDLTTIFEFDSRPLASCNSFEKVAQFYTSSFHKLDRAIRNIYAQFLQEKEIVRPLQEHYESLNMELLQHWFDHYSEYRSNQQGFLPQLIIQSKPGIAVIVGDGVRYEIAANIASQLESKCKVTLNTMLADMPSETEHNMSALYVGNGSILPNHKDRERKLSELTGKEISFIDLEALHYGIKADYLVLTYKDIDSTGEKLQQGAIKLFKEFEDVLLEKIQLLLNMGYHSVHLVTDHGFVLTGILDEADKIDPSASGKKEVHERYIRTAEKQNSTDWLAFEEPYGEYGYVYAAKNNKPFKSKGVYGFSHGGFTPQEIIIPNFVFRKEVAAVKGLDVTISNKMELSEVTGELFGLKIQAKGKADDLFSSSRKVQLLLYANNIKFSSSNIITIETGASNSFDFSFGGHNEITVVLIDAASQEQIDSVKIKKSNARDLGGLL